MEILIKTVKLSTIKLNPDNPRRISNQDMDRLVKSLQDFPDMMKLREIIVDETMTVLGGNMRLLALRKIGAKDCTAKIVKGLTPEQKREFAIKDNSNFGTWDFDALANGWTELPLTDWGLSLPEDWLVPMEVIDSSGNMSGANYGDARGDKIPVNILGIGGMVERALMERVKKKLLDNGADEKADNADQLSDIFLTWVNK